MVGSYSDRRVFHSPCEWEKSWKFPVFFYCFRSAFLEPYQFFLAITCLWSVTKNSWRTLTAFSGCWVIDSDIQLAQSQLAYLSMDLANIWRIFKRDQYSFPWPLCLWNFSTFDFPIHVLSLHHIVERFWGFCFSEPWYGPFREICQF